MASIFGSFFDKAKLKDEKREELVNSNKISTDNDDGAVEIDNALTEFFLNSGNYSTNKELVENYREIASYGIVDYAIEDIINEMVSFSENESAVSLDLSNLEDDLSENIRKKVYECWENVTNLLNLNNTIHNRARQFYTDGKLAYQKVVNQKKLTDGLIGVVELDSKYVTKVRQTQYDEQNKTIKEIVEYFTYEYPESENNKNRTHKESLVLDKNTLVYVTSGIVDKKTGFSLSWLHKAIQPANQLKMMENALVVYRITRAPERRIFYIDTGGLTKTKAEQYIRNLKNSYSNRMSFDPESGSFKDKKHLQTMQENFWLPRNSNGKGTEVSTLSGGSNLGDIEDVRYFQKLLYKSLNIPTTRLEDESSLIGGRGSEISRDELKFSKFVSRIRKRFNLMFIDLLGTDVLLKKIMTPSEWEEIKNRLSFVYAKDLELEELRKMEIERERLELLNDYRDYVGKYVSHNHMRKHILMQTEQEMEEIDKEISEEMSVQQYKDEENSRY